MWKCLVRSSSTVAERCVRAGQEDAERFRVYRERKDKVIQEFGVLCVDDFREVFVKPLLGTLDLLEKYENEASTVHVEGRQLSKYEALFAETAGARYWQKTVVEEACLENSFEKLLRKIHLVAGSLLGRDPITAFARSVHQATECNYESARVPFPTFSMTCTPRTWRQWRRTQIITSATSSSSRSPGARGRTLPYLCTTRCRAS